MKRILMELRLNAILCAPEITSGESSRGSRGKTLKLHLFGILGCLLLLTSCGPAPASNGVPDAAVILPATNRVELIDVGGRKLQMLTRGQGSPTVVIEAGMGEPPIESGSWTRVVDEIAKSNRVVLYDRAGLGKSDPAPKLPRTSLDVANDLSALLAKAGGPGPYLLVGHSFGGLHIRMFASQFPEKVAGMVLVDASHPDQDQRWIASFGPASSTEPEPVKKVREFLGSRTTPSSNPENIDPKATSTQIKDARGLGDKPLVILTHSAGFKIDPNLPDDTLRRIEAVWTEIQTEFQRLSTRSTLIQSRTGGHNLPGEDPDLVVAGIRTALDLFKAQTKQSP